VPASLGGSAVDGVVNQKRGDHRRERNLPEVIVPVWVPVLASAILVHTTAPTVLIQRSNNRRTKSRLRGRLESREETPVVDTTDSRHGTAEILNAALMSANLCHVLSRRSKHPVDACATDAEPTSDLGPA
jgi:hypothetical protein